MEMLGIIGAIAGFAKGVVNFIGAEEERVSKFNELDRKRTELRKYYNQNVSQAKEETADKNAYLQTEMNQTAAAQETARKQAGQNIAAQGILYNAQIAELQVQVSEAQGSAIQSAAVSGFRGSSDLGGSIGTGLRQASRAGERAIQQAQVQARASRMQSYQSALNNYTSAEYQKALYAQQMTMNERTLKRTLDSFDLEYELTDDAYLRDQETLGSTKYKLLNFFGAGLDLVSSSIDVHSAFSEYKAKKSSATE